MDKNKIENFVIFGIGAAGANTFLHLLYTFPAANFMLVDFDSVEDRNITAGTQPYGRADLKRPKTQAMQRIASMLKNKKIDVLNAKINNKKEIIDLVKNPSTTLIIDAFDNAASRNLFIDLGKKYNVLHIGFSADLSGEAVWDGVFTKMETSPNDKAADICQMTLARPFIFALTSLAATVIAGFADNGKKINMYFDRHLNIKKF